MNIHGSFRKYLPPSNATNYCLDPRERAHAEASLNGRNPGSAIDGDGTLKSFVEGKSGWRTQAKSQYPAIFMIQFSTMVEIDTVVVRSWPDHAKGRNRQCLRDYNLYGIASGDWEKVAEIRGNSSGINIHRFSQRPLCMIKIEMLSTNASIVEEFPLEVADEDVAHLLQVEAYCLGQQDLYQTEKIEISCERGPKGAVAIWHEKDLPAPAGQPHIGRLRKFFEERGYGVSVLSAKALCCEEIFNRKNFNILVHPHGEYFPLGTCLYEFLEQGGHLVSFGGRCMTNALELFEGKWQPTGWDSALCQTRQRWVDYHAQYREQLGLFAGAPVAFQASQLQTSDEKAIQGNFRGTSVTASLGALLTDEEEEALHAQGRIQEYWYKIRKLLKANKKPWHDFTQNRAGADSPNYRILFNRVQSRWLPLLSAKDALGNDRGTAAAIVANYERRYRGSLWIACSVDNTDMTALPMHWLEKPIQAIEHNTLVHDFMADYSAFHPGEPVRLSAWIDHFGPEPFKGTLVWSVEGIADVEEEISLAPGDGRKVAVTIPQPFPEGFYKIRLSLKPEKAQPLLFGEEENAFVVVDTAKPQKGPSLEVSDNFFLLDGKPEFIVGCRHSGIHMHNQSGETMLDWQRDAAKLRDNGLRVISPIFLDDYVAELLGGGPQKATIPEEILREYEAQAFVANRSGVIYAPCLFFASRIWVQALPQLSAGICEAVGERLKNFPGVYFYLYDDGWPIDPDTFNHWIENCKKGFEKTGRRFLLSAEMGNRTFHGYNVRDCAKLFDFTACSSFTFAQDEPIAMRAVDMRVSGKPHTVAEFGARNSTGRYEERRLYAVEPFLQFCAGHALILNWMWKDASHLCFPWGLNHMNDGTPKEMGLNYRNAALFFSAFTPCCKVPKVAFLRDPLPDIQKVRPWAHDFAKCLDGLLHGRIDFTVVDEWNLKALPNEIEILIVQAKYSSLRTHPKAKVMAVSSPQDLFDRLQELPGIPFAPSNPAILTFEPGVKDYTIRAFCASPRFPETNHPAGTPFLDLERATYPKGLQPGIPVEFAENNRKYELSVQGFGCGLVVLNHEGLPVAYEGEGELKVDGKTWLSSDCHVWVRSEDGSPIDRSSSLFLASDAKGGEVTITRSEPLKTLTAHGQSNGRIKEICRKPISSGSDGLKLVLDEALARNVMHLYGPE